MVKNPSTIQETEVRFLGQEDLLEEDKWQPTPVLLPGKMPWTEEPAGYSPWGHRELDMTERLNNKSTGSTFGPIEATLVGLLGGNWSLERLGLKALDFESYSHPPEKGVNVEMETIIDQTYVRRPP